MKGDDSQINKNLHIFLTSIISWVCGLGYYLNTKQMHLENHSCKKCITKVEKLKKEEELNRRMNKDEVDKSRKRRMS